MDSPCPRGLNEPKTEPAAGEEASQGCSRFFLHLLVSERRKSTRGLVELQQLVASRINEIWFSVYSFYVFTVTQDDTWPLGCRLASNDSSDVNDCTKEWISPQQYVLKMLVCILCRELNNKTVLQTAVTGMDLGASNVSLISKDLRFPVWRAWRREALPGGPICQGGAESLIWSQLRRCPSRGGCVSALSGLQHLQVDALLSLSL